MLALKQNNEADALVKQLLNDLKKTENEVISSKALNKYEKEKILSYKENISKSSIKKTIASDDVEDVSIEIICYKIIFYQKQYETYSRYFNRLKLLNTASTKVYRTELNKFVRHLNKKIQVLFINLEGVKNEWRRTYYI